MVAVAWNLNLAGIKALINQSIQGSMLTTEERQLMSEVWKGQWDHWVDTLVQDHS